MLTGSEESDDSDDSEDEDEAEAANPQPAQRRLRIRATDEIDIETLPAHIQAKIAALRDSIKSKRPPEATHSQRGTRRKRLEKWLKEEDTLLVLLRNLGFGYNQIADKILKWRGRNPLEKRVGHLQKERERKQKKKKARRQRDLLDTG
ncbi:hypothetical protein NEMBOFW57_010293 [Staphylotrichum longicolle]|uniref:Uncharacterized protein n=1 Tax=Staphylotrichum longicolle TaxID=669026 RepID=A0AAD4HV53_9PEZI|nr:hypothetical protein NEMBOFW57_010293 [Staphylotrichum longicolle]